jgi:hypothetical protein
MDATQRRSIWIIIAITKAGFRSIRCVWKASGGGSEKGLLVDRPKGI